VSRANGVVVYEGPSAMDGAPIAVVAILESANQATGPMVQTYIFRSDVHPVQAQHAGMDASVCGSCALRGHLIERPTLPFPTLANEDRRCYVLVWREVAQIWSHYRAGKYPRLTHPESLRSLGYCRAIRLGSYGDPAAAPVTLWEALCADARLVTGYTHQWRTHAALKPFCMASVDSVAEAAEASSMGWRYYRTRRRGELEQLAGEIVCPKSAEAGRRLTCIECRHCDGARSGRRGNVVINLHGPSAAAREVQRQRQA
jgi:hypothetical protein